MKNDRDLRNIGVRVVLLVCCMLIFACDTENQYSTKYRCSFYFDTAKHPTSILTRSLSNPGMWVFVSVQQKQGVNHVMVSPNSGNKNDDEDIAMTTEIENNRINYNNLGANNGIIVGCSNFNGIMAYDRMCPHCLEKSKDSPLEWDDNKQQVRCKACKLTYMLETGNCTTEKLLLLKYKVAYGGEGKPLQVYN